MRTIILFIGFSLILSSCYKNKTAIKKFEGVWKASSKETTLYDSISGKEISNSQSEINAELTLRKDSLFTASGVTELTPDGHWAVRMQGKKDLIQFWQETAILYDFDLSVTVNKKAKKEMNLVFYTVDDSGRLVSKTEYFFKYDKEIDYNPATPAPTCNGLLFNDSQGNSICLPVINFINEASTYTPVGEPSVSYRRVVLVFSNSLSGSEARYVEMTMNFPAQTNAVTSGLYPFNNSTFELNTVTSFLYAEGTTHFNAVNVQGFNIANGSLNDQKMKGNISQLNFDTPPPSIGSNNLNNLSLDFDF